MIAAAAAITVATGGAAAGTVVAAINCAASGALNGAIIGAATGAVSGAVGGAITHRVTTGSWNGSGQAALDGAASGFMSGAITGAVTGAVSSPNCFVAGTAVLTATGTVAIETIKAGDLVWAWDEETGDVALKEVVETYVNESDELVHVYVNGEEIVATPKHPFYSPVKGWTDAAHLRAGDILVLVNGEYAVVEKVQHELLETPVKVYNFQVKDYHTYYVANVGVLVHNICTDISKDLHQSSSWKTQRRNYWKAHANTPSDLYDLTSENIALMQQGKAPFGFDGFRIELHHIDGIANSDSIRAISHTSHVILHKMIGYTNFLPYSF